MTKFTCLTAALLFTGLVAVAQPSHAQEPPSGTTPQAQGQDHQTHHPAPAEQPVTPAQETEMAGMQQKMMADMKAMDARLDALVTKMNAAKGDAKIEAMADVLTTVVQQRATMRDRMMNMQSQMMGHMMRHMSSGMSPEMKKMMSECPMMKQMGAAKEK